MGNQPNLLVNNQTLVADNRAGDYVEITPGGYNGTEDMRVYAI